MQVDLTPSRPLSEAELATLWERLAQSPETPDNFELTEYGEIIWRPSPTNRHQLVIAWAQEQLSDQLGCRVVAGLAVTTRAGIRKPDAAWLPESRWSEALSSKPLSNCPSLVVEVLSPRDTMTASAHKVSAYLGSGAEEVVVIDLQGVVSYERADGTHTESAKGLELNPPTEMFSPD